jgi:hypothetical protein
LEGNEMKLLWTTLIAAALFAAPVHAATTHHRVASEGKRQTDQVNLTHSAKIFLLENRTMAVSSRVEPPYPTMEY